MKGNKVRAVDMVRGIRDRQAKALAGKSTAEVIAFYRAAGEAAMQDVTPSGSRRRRPAAKALPTSRATRKAKSPRQSRAARG